jgi:hypothetical protein
MVHLRAGHRMAIAARSLDTVADDKPRAARGIPPALAGPGAAPVGGRADNRQVGSR